jgi:hypothetical protein
MEVEDRWDSGGKRQLTGRESRVLLTWCAEHGLLGLLLMDLRSLTTWSATDEDMQMAQAERPESDWQCIYERRGLFWSRRLRRVHPRHGHTTPHAVVQMSDGSIARWDLHGDQWRAYFGWALQDRDARKKYPYPEPGSEGFWHLYGEPVSNIVFAVADWARAWEAIAKGCADPATAQEYVNARASRLALLQDEGGDLRAFWTGAALFDHCATMAILGYESRQLKTCDRCGAPFFATTYQQIYCTPRCKEAARKSRARKARLEEGQ